MRDAIKFMVSRCLDNIYYLLTITVTKHALKPIYKFVQNLPFQSDGFSSSFSILADSIDLWSGKEVGEYPFQNFASALLINLDSLLDFPVTSSAMDYF